MSTRCLLTAVAVAVAIAASTADAADQAAGADLPLQAVCTLATLPGRITGAAVLAEYPAPGPGHVIVELAAPPGRRAVAGGWQPTTLIKVIAPDGSLTACAEPTVDQAQVRIELAVPAGPAGIWRVAVVGGRDGDRVTFALPASAAWGLRGEMALGLASESPHRAWLWIPPGNDTLLAMANGRGGVALADATGHDLPVQREDRGKRLLWRWSGLPTGGALCVTIAPESAALSFDGAPALLCADAASAERLRGGTCVSAGRLVSGPLQARARAWMVAAAAGDLTPANSLPEASTAGTPEPLAALQLYGRFGPLGGLKHFLAGQVLDPAAEDFGTFHATADAAAPSLHGAKHAPFDAGGLASAISAAVEPNPAYHDRALTARATLSAFYHLSRLQGDDLLREEDLGRTNGPLIHAFFIYEGSLARGFAELRDQLTPEARAIWREGLLAVGDRLADFQGYQTNQWWHMILGHLLTHIGTGEERFRLRFERQVAELLEPQSGAHLGQHPAGYFLEGGGPDGHYDSLSGTCMAEAYHLYAGLPRPAPRVLTLLRAAIARNLVFSAYHWLPQPDGSLAGPSALSARKWAAFCLQPWPGGVLERDEFPLAATRWSLTVPAARGAGMVGTNMPFLVNSAAWARAALADLVPRSGAVNFWTGEVQAPWTSIAIAVARRPVAAPAELPCRAAAGTWELPGQIAWKRGGLYGLVFWDATGMAQSPDESCRTGGAPSALWHAATGVSLISMHNANDDRTAANNDRVTQPDDLTHVCVAGVHAGALWWSGHERATCAWITPGEILRITGIQPGSGATITWTYTIADDLLEIEVAVAGIELADPWLTLPFLDQSPGMRLDTTERGARFSAGSGALDITWTGSGQATATARLAALPLPVRCLRIPLAGAGATWNAKVRFTVGR